MTAARGPLQSAFLVLVRRLWTLLATLYLEVLVQSKADSESLQVLAAHVTLCLHDIVLPVATANRHCKAGRATRFTG